MSFGGSWQYHEGVSALKSLWDGHAALPSLDFYLHGCLLPVDVLGWLFDDADCYGGDGGAGGDGAGGGAFRPPCPSGHGKSGAGLLEESWEGPCGQQWSCDASPPLPPGNGRRLPVTERSKSSSRGLSLSRFSQLVGGGVGPTIGRLVGFLIIEAESLPASHCLAASKGQLLPHFCQQRSWLLESLEGHPAAEPARPLQAHVPPADWTAALCRARLLVKPDLRC